MYTFYTPEQCCDNPEIITNEVEKVCINCATISVNSRYEEVEIIPTFLSPKFTLKTVIGYCGPKHNHLYRLKKWEFDYKENKAIISYNQIKQICNRYNLSVKLQDNACKLYKSIYIDENISSRSKIKTSLHVYCIKKNCKYFNIEFSVIDVLKEFGLSIQNYNKAIYKIKDSDKKYLHNDLKSYYTKTRIHYPKSKISLNDIIDKYNEILLIRNNTLNKNSLLIGSIYFLLFGNEPPIKKTKFLRVFNITNTTINKFLNNIYD